MLYLATNAMLFQTCEKFYAMMIGIVQQKYTFYCVYVLTRDWSTSAFYPNAKN